MATPYWEIRILTRALVQTAKISSTSGTGAVLSASFDIDRNNGCGRFQMTAKKSAIEGTIAARSVLEVWVKTEDGTLDRYYSGTITTLPAAGNSATVGRYEAQGIWFEAQKQLITVYYDGGTIATVLGVILGDIDNDSVISTSTSEITGGAYTIGDLEAELTPAANVIKLLANTQKSTQYGIDQDRKLYFKDLITTDQVHWWVGTHLTKFSIQETSSELVNTVYVQSKKMVGGGSLTLFRDDNTSVNNYGINAKLIQLPDLPEPNDAIRYAEGIVAENKDPKDSVTAETVGFTDFVFPAGNARITDTDGVEYTLPIQRTTYKLTGPRGFVGTLGLGDRAIVTWEKQVEEMLRELELRKNNSISLTKIEHTRGQEFQQDALFDAKDNGNQNTFFDPVDDAKVFDPALSSNITFDKDRLMLMGPFDYASMTAVSFVIPLGESVDTIRVHTDTDFYGRVNFDSQGDIEDFFDHTTAGGRNTWQLKIGAPRARNLEASDFISYKDIVAPATVPGPSTDGFRLGTDYAIRFRYTDPKASPWAIISTLIWGWIDSNNYNFISIDNNASFTTFIMNKRVAGVNTPVVTRTELKDKGYSVEVFARPAAVTTSFKIYDESESLLFTGTDNTMPSPTQSLVGLESWYAGGGVVNAEIDYFEIQEVGDVAMFLSRDNGTTYTDAGITTGVQNRDVNISAQPSGDELRVKFVITHPARLNAWGVSF